MRHPQPLDRDELARIEDAGLNASAPPQQFWMDGWLLRLSPGKAKRARCVNALAPSRAPLAVQLERARQRFDAAGLPLIVRVTPFAQPAGLDDALAAAGLQRFDDTMVMVADLADPAVVATLAAAATPLAASLAAPTAIALAPLQAQAFAELVGALRGSPAAQRRAQAERLAASPVPFHAFALYEHGQALACGQYAREAEFVGLYDIFTAPPARKRGLARMLCSALLRRAADEDARRAYLQVDAGNSAAIAVYRRLGFIDGYRYHYRAADPDRC